jgi:hypothetical protein
MLGQDRLGCGSTFGRISGADGINSGRERVGREADEADRD